MSRILKVLAIATAAVPALLLVAVAVLKLIPDDRYRQWITDAVRTATGRELDLGSDFNIDFGTSVRADARKITFANADWSSEPSLFSADEVAVELALWPLLRGVAAVTLDAHAPRLLLETNASGQGNWVMDTGPTETDEEPRDQEGHGGTVMVIAPALNINKGVFEFIDGIGGRHERFDLAGFSLTGVNQKIELTLTGEYKQQSISLSGNLGDALLLAAGKPSDLRLDGKLGGSTLKSSGSWQAPLKPWGPDFDIAVTLSTPDIHTLEPFAGVAIPNLGALDLGGRVVGQRGSLSASDLSLKLAGPKTRVSLNGEVSDLATMQGIMLAAEANADDLPAMVTGFGLELPVSVPQSLQAKASLNGSLETLILETLEATVTDGETRAALTGAASNALTLEGLEASIELHAASLSELSKFAGGDLPASGAVDAKAKLTSKDGRYQLSDLDATIAGDEINATVKGKVADLLAVSGIELELDAHVGSLAGFSEVAGMELPDTTPLNVKARATAKQGKDGSARIVADLDSDWLKGKVDATITDLLTGQGLDGDLNIELKSLAMLSLLAGRELPAMGPIKVAGHVASQQQTYALSDLALNIKDPNLTASLTGAIEDLLAGSGIDLKLDAKIGSLASFSKLAGTELPETKPLRLAATATANEGVQGPTTITATLDSDWLKGKIDTTIADILNGRGLDANLDLVLQSLADISSIAGRDFPTMGPVTAKGKVKSVEDSFSLTGLDLGIDDPALQARLTGSVGDLVAVSGIALKLDGTVASLAGLSELVGTELPDTPSISVKAKLDAASGLKGKTEVAATLSSDAVNIETKSTITDLTQAQELRLQVLVEAHTLADIGRLSGMELPAVGPYKSSATVIATADQVDLIDLIMDLGNSDLRGDLKVILPTESTKGNATGLFKSTRLDVNQLTGQDQAAPQPPADGQPAATGNATASTENDARVFPDTPLPLDFIREYEGYIELDVERLEARSIVIDKGRATVSIDNDKLDIQLHRADVGGRPISGQLQVDAGRTPAAVSTKFKADKVPMSGVLDSEAILHGGHILVDIDTQGTGGSVREIMAGLNGHASVAMVDTRLSTAAASRFGKDMVSQLNPFAADKGYSEIECAAAAFAIKDGIATTPRGVVSRDTAATWLGDGQIDLKTEQIEFTLQSKAREGLGISAASLASLVQITGTLASPSIAPDPVGVAEKGAEAALAISTGGLSIIAKGLFNRATSERGICESILQTIILGTAPGSETAGEK